MDKLTDIERGAAYYARASAYRAVHGILPPGDAEADAKYWHAISIVTRDEMLKMVAGIFAAASPFAMQTAASTSTRESSE